MGQDTFLMSYLESWLGRSGYQPAIILTGEIMATQGVIDRVQTMAATEDVISLSPDEGKITIQRVRFLLARTKSTGWHGYRLVIIHEAEKLTSPAEQALLKFLEEPQDGIRILLTTQWPRRLAVTLRSRCLVRRVTSHIEMTSESKLAQDVLIRFAQYKGEVRLVNDVMTHLAFQLDQQLKTQGPSISLKRAFLRLRDYYLISASPAGNTKLARDVLLASLPD